jgi:hypothetical protein
MNTVTSAAPAANKNQIMANVRRWRREHGLESKPTNRRFVNRPTFTHKGDRAAMSGGGK